MSLWFSLIWNISPACLFCSLEGSSPFFGGRSLGLGGGSSWPGSGHVWPTEGLSLSPNAPWGAQLSPAVCEMSVQSSDSGVTTTVLLACNQHLVKREFETVENPVPLLPLICWLSPLLTFARISDYDDDFNLVSFLASLLLLCFNRKGRASLHAALIYFCKCGFTDSCLVVQLLSRVWLCGPRDCLSQWVIILGCHYLAWCSVVHDLASGVLSDWLLYLLWRVPIIYGALPYFLTQWNVPGFCSFLTPALKSPLLQGALVDFSRRQHEETHSGHRVCLCYRGVTASRASQCTEPGIGEFASARAYVHTHTQHHMTRAVLCTPVYNKNRVCIHASIPVQYYRLHFSLPFPKFVCNSLLWSEGSFYPQRLHRLTQS